MTHKYKKGDTVMIHRLVDTPDNKTQEREWKAMVGKQYTITDTIEDRYVLNAGTWQCWLEEELISKSEIVMQIINDL